MNEYDFKNALVYKAKCFVSFSWPISILSMQDKILFLKVRATFEEGEMVEHCGHAIIFVQYNNYSFHKTYKNHNDFYQFKRFCIF